MRRQSVVRSTNLTAIVRPALVTDLIKVLEMCVEGGMVGVYQTNQEAAKYNGAWKPKD